jgi:hypothetical protein
MGTNIFNCTYTIPRMIGNVNVDELTDFWHLAEVSLAAQVLEDELVVVVAALRASTTLSGTARLITDSILPIMFDSAAAIRGPSLLIFAACLSMPGAAILLPIVGR